MPKTTDPISYTVSYTVNMQDLHSERLLVLSTAHLTEAEARDELVQLGRSTLSRPEGFMIHTRLGAAADEADSWNEEDRLLSDGARVAFKVARQRGYEWILFDADGPVVDGIPTSEWYP